MTARPIAPPEFDRLDVGSARLDVRPRAAFDLGHLAGSGQLEPHDFLEQRAELPPRDLPVVTLAASAADAEAAALQLDAMGFRDVAWLAAPLAEVPGGLDARDPPARLWRPSPFLVARLPELPRGSALDLAAGSGREAVYLAMNGFDVEAWDHAPEALERATRLATRHGVTLRTRVVDLERKDVRLPEAAFDLVTCFRFLHRPLFPHIAAAVRPGGHVVYETYRVGQERFGRPRHRRFLLDDGELSSALPGFHVVHYEEPSPEGGPILARLHACRPHRS